MISKLRPSAALVSGILSMVLSVGTVAEEMPGVASGESVRSNIAMQQNSSSDLHQDGGLEQEERAGQQAVLRLELASSRKDVLKELNLRLAEVQQDS